MQYRHLDQLNIFINCCTIHLDAGDSASETTFFIRLRFKFILNYVKNANTNLIYVFSWSPALDTFSRYPNAHWNWFLIYGEIVYTIIHNNSWGVRQNAFGNKKRGENQKEGLQLNAIARMKLPSTIVDLVTYLFTAGITLLLDVEVGSLEKINGMFLY